MMALPPDVAACIVCGDRHPALWPCANALWSGVVMNRTQAHRFREAKRTQQSFLASAEKKTLLWLAARTPSWINSDHLTVLGLGAMAAAGAGYWWSRTNRAGLIVVIICLA